MGQSISIGHFHGNDTRYRPDMADTLFILSFFKYLAKGITFIKLFIHRNRLTPEYGEMLMFINYNLSYLS